MASALRAGGGEVVNESGFDTRTGARPGPAGDVGAAVLQDGLHLRLVLVAALGGEADKVVGIPLHRALGVERQDRVDDVVGVENQLVMLVESDGLWELCRSSF